VGFLVRKTGKRKEGRRRRKRGEIRWVGEITRGREEPRKLRPVKRCHAFVTRKCMFIANCNSPKKKKKTQGHIQKKKNYNQLQLKAIPPARLAILPYSLFISSDDYYVYSTGDNSPIFISGGATRPGRAGTHKCKTIYQN
jgi:hypothetical protein